MNDDSTPRDWARAELAVADFQERMAGLSRIPPDVLRLRLAMDKIAQQFDNELLGLCGVYILFYPTGEIARVGKANPRTFKKRIYDYEMHRRGWFEYRWAAVIPVDSRHVRFINLLESYLIFVLYAPENDGGEAPE
jgi:hypothetical protein